MPDHTAAVAGSGGGKSKSKSTKTPLSDSKPTKDKNSNTVVSQPTVIAVPEDISDHVHVLSAKVGGVALRYTITYVELFLCFIVINDVLIGRYCSSGAFFFLQDYSGSAQRR